jgi:hypothetical protein
MLREDDMAVPNGSLLALVEAHEDRLQRVEGTATALLATTAVTNSKLDAIGNTVLGIDAKLDASKVALDQHKAEDQDVALKVHDLEQSAATKDKKKSNLEYAFWTAVAGIGVDLICKLIEHIPKLMALLK